MILAVKLVMTLATLFFAVGLAFPRRNNPLHRILMSAGFLSTVAIAVVLVVGVQIFGAGYEAAPWLVQVTGGVEGAARVLITHRLVATVTFFALFFQVVAGFRRKPVHTRFFKVVIPLWIITYLSGLVIFV